jgi:glucose/arabinose dehydrogenase
LSPLTLQALCSLSFLRIVMGVEQPGNRYMIKAADLPAPYATDSASNQSRIVPRPRNVWPKVPEGFKIDLALTGNLKTPRTIVTAPNGDLFVAESDANHIRIIRGFGSDGKVETSSIFATDLTMPYGIAFYPPGPNPTHVYIGNTNSVVRFPYRNGDMKASGPAEKIANIPDGSRFGGGHWTRSIAFSNDGKKLFVGVGSKENVGEDADEKNRADVLEFNPDGSGGRIYASGIRNPSGLMMHPKTGQLWVAVNERDELGDDLVPDYVTHVAPGGFYGWPWYYIGPNQDPRFKGKRPDLKEKVIVPDVLLQSHSAPLSLTYYDGKQFPAEYDGDLFVTSHGSWNRSHLTGYKVIRLYSHDGNATGEYQDFVTGFVLNNADVWGRPVGITVALDGSLVFTDDASNSIWRVTYVGNKNSMK